MLHVNIFGVHCTASQGSFLPKKADTGQEAQCHAGQVVRPGVNTNTVVTVYESSHPRRGLWHPHQ